MKLIQEAILDGNFDELLSIAQNGDRIVLCKNSEKVWDVYPEGILVWKNRELLVNNENIIASDVGKDCWRSHPEGFVVIRKEGFFLKNETLVYDGPYHSWYSCFGGMVICRKFCENYLFLLNGKELIYETNDLVSNWSTHPSGGLIIRSDSTICLCLGKNRKNLCDTRNVRVASNFYGLVILSEGKFLFEDRGELSYENSNLIDVFLPHSSGVVIRQGDTFSLLVYKGKS